MTSPDPSSQRTNHVTRLNERTPSLLEAMTDLFEQGQKPHHDAFPDHFGPANDRAAITRYLQGFLKPRNPLRKRNGYAMGWFVDGTLAGYLLYRLHQTSNVFYGKTRWTCFVEDIVVDERTRGLGGASALMGALLQEAERLDNCAVSGAVWNMNPASEALFLKHGFEPLSQTFYKVFK